MPPPRRRPWFCLCPVQNIYSIGHVVYWHWNGITFIQQLYLVTLVPISIVGTAYGCLRRLKPGCREECIRLVPNDAEITSI